MIRVGTIKNAGDQNNTTFPGFVPIVVLTKSSKYGSLGPYVLKDDDGVIIENRWQFSKVYKTVPATTQRYSQWDPTIVWNHPSETHAVVVDETEDEIRYKLTKEYWKWRTKGFQCKHGIRYPVGFSRSARKSCLFSIEEKGSEPLDYVEARKKIYAKYYITAAKKEPQFTKLKKMLDEGKNLLILEVDGPRQESMKYYKQKYDVPDDWIQDRTIEITPENMGILINDTVHPFGHGFCLASALLDIDLESL